MSEKQSVVKELWTGKESAGSCGISEKTWFRMCDSGRAPQGVRLSARCRRWRRREILDWLEAGCPRVAR